MSDGSKLVLLSDYAGGGAGAGGVGVAVLDSYRALRREGYRCRLLTGFAPAAALDDAHRPLGGVDLRDGARAARLRALFNPAAAATLAEVLAPIDPARAVIVLHAWTRWLSPAAIRVLRPYRTVIVMHDYFWVCPNGAYYNFREERPCRLRPGGLACATSGCDRRGAVDKAGRLLRHALRAWAAAGMRYPPLFAHLSHRAKATVAHLLPEGGHIVLHNPLDAGAAAGRSTPCFDIGYIGRFEPEKGVAEVLDWVRRRAASGLFVGAGSLGPEIDRTPGAVRSDWVAHGEVAAAMRRCRAIVLPSRWPETWGLVIPEAMAAGVPVVVSTRAGSAELVERFGGGIVFDPATPGALDAALDHARAGIEPLGVAARIALAEHLSASRHARSLVNAIAGQWGVEIARDYRGSIAAISSARAADADVHAN